VLCTIWKDIVRGCIVLKTRIGQDAAGGKNVHIGADIWPKKTQSENHCEYFNSVLRTLTKFVLFSNQKVRKYVHL
jgi:hypothetical protein